jgi:hypothetical protein
MKNERETETDREGKPRAPVFTHLRQTKCGLDANLKSKNKLEADGSICVETRIKQALNWMQKQRPLLGTNN